MKMKNIIIFSAFITVTVVSILFSFSSSDNPKVVVQNVLALADIQINGERSWDMAVHNEDFYSRVLSEGSLGLGESYMDGWWDSKALDQFFYKLVRAKVDEKVKLSWPFLRAWLKAKFMNLQSKSRAFEVGEHHYDLGNELFQLMLDKRMVYSCGYWKHATNLDEAQEAKLELICKKLGLKPGMKVLDLGCGWGCFAQYAAQKYGVEVVGVSVSKEQLNYARQLCKDLPIDIRLQDYRDLNETFDRIVSLAMFEAVGYKNFKTYMEVVHRCLKDDGLFLLHTIGNNTSTITGEPWMMKYIFPNGVLPSIKQIGETIEGLFVMEDWHNFGADYDKTLMAWSANFDKHWPKIASKYGERFYRMWKYYLLACAGNFRSRDLQLWQVVLSKQGVEGGYTPIR